MKLRPLYVVTGTVRAEGGRTNRSQKMQGEGNVDGGAERMTIVQRREITKERKRADVIATSYMRSIRQLGLIRTPFGILVDKTRLRSVQDLLSSVTTHVGAFNTGSKGCRLWNCTILEPLRDNRLAAVEGWLARKMAEGDKDVASAIGEVEGAETQAAS